MKNCPNCHAEMEDHDQYCPVCGSAANAYVPPNTTYQEPVEITVPEIIPDPYDHTEEFSREDIRNHRLLCMLMYLLDFVGIIIALLAAKESEYTAFHMKHAMRFTILEALVAIAVALLSWTVIVPVLGAIAMVVLVVIKLTSFVHVCKDQARDPVLIRNITFLN